MAAKPSSRAEAWALFDAILAAAAPGGEHSNPWFVGTDGQLQFEPDYDTLERLLGVPLHLKATTRSGVPALALDIWLSYELRRAGFGPDQVWPRATSPRILPAPIVALVDALPASLRVQFTSWMSKQPSIKGATAASAVILGKNYMKQVDVVIADWKTGPELLVSTKRMDSSYGKNAPNRIEESYGDAKNLRLRHPLAALGFMFGVRSDILTKEPNTAEWLFDLLKKLGREDDAYHATCLVLMEYGAGVSLPEVDEEEPSAVVMDPDSEPEGEGETPVHGSFIINAISSLPSVKVLQNLTPGELAPSRFLAKIVVRLLETTPVQFHTEARSRLAKPTRYPSPVPATP